MLLKAYELIKKLQTEIGNEAQVSLSAVFGRLFVRVDWMKNDFHAQYQFSEIELAQVADDSLPITYIIEWFKNEYSQSGCGTFDQGVKTPNNACTQTRGSLRIEEE